METYLNVPFSEHKGAKFLGARWNGEQWFYKGSLENFSNLYKWLDKSSPLFKTNRLYLDVPNWADNDIIKNLGAKWDNELKNWYYDGPFENYYKFSNWIPFTCSMSISKDSNSLQRVKELEQELNTANDYIQLLQNKLNDYLQENQELRLLLNQSSNNNEFPLFQGCNTREKLRQRYKLLCKLLHPDNDITKATKNFQEIQQQYNELLSRMN